MINLIILVFCSIISSGYLQEFDYSSFPSIDNSGRTGWPLQVYYEKPQVQRKPCPHRRNNVQGEEQWVPSFRSTVTKPRSNFLEPQSLKNENEDTDNGPKDSHNLNIPADESTILDTLPTESSPNEKSKIASHNDPNAAKDTSEEPNRRSNFNDKLSNGNEELFSDEYDCDLDPDADDYFQSQYRDGNYLVTSTPSTDGIEQKVIELLWNCINKKQKFIKEKINQLEEIPLAGSRRSMGGSNNDDETTPDTNESTTDTVDTIIDDKLNESGLVTDKLNVTPAFTLRPGKLFNELQNPAKVTDIADIPATRRMQGENARVCYACSTATNPSCWKPDSRTTIKYCRENQNCVTKSFGVKNSLTVLRDCTESCDAPGVAGVTPKYKSCSVCHKDLCNSAVINSYNLLIIFFITVFKCIF